MRSNEKGKKLTRGWKKKLLERKESDGGETKEGRGGEVGGRVSEKTGVRRGRPETCKRSGGKKTE